MNNEIPISIILELRFNIFSLFKNFLIALFPTENETKVYQRKSIIEAMEARWKIWKIVVSDLINWEKIAKKKIVIFGLKKQIKKPSIKFSVSNFFEFILCFIFELDRRIFIDKKTR